jgi:hypothetical protein
MKQEKNKEKSRKNKKTEVDRELSFKGSLDEECNSLESNKAKSRSRTRDKNLPQPEKREHKSGKHR